MKNALIRLIMLYRRYISPLTAPHCRFTPTCSAYALEAIEKYGWRRGLLRSIYRVMRCNPFNKGGYDPA